MSLETNEDSNHRKTVAILTDLLGWCMYQTSEIQFNPNGRKVKPDKGTVCQATLKMCFAQTSFPLAREEKIL